MHYDDYLCAPGLDQGYSGNVIRSTDVPTFVQTFGSCQVNNPILGNFVNDVFFMEWRTAFKWKY